MPTSIFNDSAHKLVLLCITPSFSFEITEENSMKVDKDLYHRPTT